MTNGPLKDRNKASTSSSSTSSQKIKESNARHCTVRKENQKAQDRNVASTSSASTPAEKRIEYQARYYASRRENNKVSKVGSNDVSQINSSHMTPENVPRTPTLLGNSTPATTFPNAPDEVMPLISRGIQIQLRTLLPQFREVSVQPSIRDVNTKNQRILTEVIPGVSQGIRDENVDTPDPYDFVYEDSEVPNELYRLFTSQDECGKLFRKHIHAYNSNFSFASMGVTLDVSVNNMRDGIFTFRAHKGIYHNIDQLVLRDGTPRYLQLYFYDPETELDHRLQWPNLDRSITEILTRVLSTNPYVHTFQTLGQLGPLDNYRVTLNASVELDQRVYNRPATSEVAGIWVEGNDDVTSFKRSIVVYDGRSEQPSYIQPHFGCYDPLSYPLFFPNGETGWHENIPRQGASFSEAHNNQDDNDEEIEEANTGRRRTTMAMREYYCYKFQIRSTENVLLFGCRLLQQFAADVYIKLETSRLQYCQLNQAKIRADLYQALLAEIPSRGLIALATTSSGAAANNFPGGRTAHSRFKIPIKLENNSMCNINKQSGAAEVIRSCKIIIWDEASMAKRQAIEVVSRTLQDIIGVRLPFGAKIMVMGGDFRQVLLVVKRGTRA
ncbi:hypothetical protein SSX86_008591 [Deinandra increscens subsp. villosa]|uniref:ATP-dependent DNA helicase n=1 Tax=Deinandra increscens subsp. villosa TaxID=3103831 RepID=A0AAP0DJC2_9ASTR